MLISCCSTPKNPPATDTDLLCPEPEGCETDEPSGVDPEQCRLEWSGGSGVGIGSPRPTERLKTTGTVNISVLFADFPDVAADRTPQDVHDILSPGAEEFFAANSYGKLTVTLEPHLTWLRLSQPSAHYAEGIRTFFGHREFLAEAVALADDDVDFSQADVVVVMSTPNAATIGVGPTWMGNFDFPLEADGATITNGITSGADLLHWGHLWLNHELGHSMSLPDLYEFGAPNGFTRPFSVMDDIGEDAPEYLAWERWQLGWLDDDQILCDAFGGTISLTAIESASEGTRAAMVRLDDRRVLTVESRRPIGYDNDLVRPGVVVSLVDAALQTGAGPIRVLNDQAALLETNTRDFEGVTVTVISSTDDGDRIQLSR
ncbi:MAG: hypothetical protein AAFV53_42740 [Myxococcota bacterium]